MEGLRAATPVADRSGWSFPGAVLGSVAVHALLVALLVPFRSPSPPPMPAGFQEIPVELVIDGVAVPQGATLPLTAALPSPPAPDLAPAADAAAPPPAPPAVDLTPAGPDGPAPDLAPAAAAPVGQAADVPSAPEAVQAQAPPEAMPASPPLPATAPDPPAALAASAPPPPLDQPGSPVADLALPPAAVDPSEPRSRTCRSRLPLPMRPGLRLPPCRCRHRLLPGWLPRPPRSKRRRRRPASAGP
jgi:hypothetical protein